MMKKSADAVVIGGGVHGVSTALHLARRGMKNVVLVEKRYLGAGSTEWSLARLIPQHGTEEMVKMTNKGIEIFYNWDDTIGGGGDPQAVCTGRIWCGGEERVEDIRAAAEQHKQWGAKIRYLSQEEVKEMYSYSDIKVDDMAIAVLYPDVGYCNPVTTVNALAARARQLGASIYEDTEATSIKVAGGKIQSVVTNQGEISTPIVVNAAGLWADRIGRMVGVDIPIKVTLQEVTLYRPPWDFNPVFPQVHDTLYEATYGPDHSRLVRAYDHFRVVDVEIVDPDTYSHDATPETIVLHKKMMTARFATLARASYRGSANGAYDQTPDNAPLLGPVPQVNGFYLNCGWSGNGLMVSPVMGDVMAELILTGRTTFVDVSKFHLGRFAEGKLLSGHWYSPDEKPVKILKQRRQELYSGQSA